jgi:hypothetical protein
MFILPLLILPFLLAAAVYRLYSVPHRVLAGSLQLAQTPGSLTTVLTVCAYLGLLGYSAGLVLAVVLALFKGRVSFSDWLSLAPVFAGYPLVYIATEWVFYYGFKRPPKDLS